ncbi:leucyl aminopeptidase [Vibrio aquimaris]|uniref:Leucyl aminopeptidase n=1 Tax=Vibrio aquimaris TaxID=2587862 RepID=A0A5P9CP43_9VIBR|nr:leucyl aminopeptidase [Vibrio aquimaris]QFT28015.1 hypothetical protein FIV01_16625 [Vibrio aquimaris]
MESSTKNMYDCLSSHPVYKEKREKGQSITILIGSDIEHQYIARGLLNAKLKNTTIKYIALDREEPKLILGLIEECDIFIFLYASSTLESPSPQGPRFLRPLKQHMTLHWKKSVLFKDYGKYFFEAFSEKREYIKKRNNKLISQLSSCSSIRFEDGYGGQLLGSLSKDHKWTSIDGHGNTDIIPGEIATHILDLNGSITFSGTFLSTIPFAIRFGVSNKLCRITVENSKIVDCESDNEHFKLQFNQYLLHHKNHNIIEEFGIGTNMGIKQLYGRNAGFEERHPGLHLGLGGGQQGSHHMDLIFSNGKLFMEDSLFFNSGQFILDD